MLVHLPGRGLRALVLGRQFQSRDLSRLKVRVMRIRSIDDLSEFTEKQLNDNEYVDAIDRNIKTLGLQYFLSILTVDDFETICKEMDLQVDNTGSKERLIDAIIEKKNYTKPKTRNIKPSKEKLLFKMELPWLI